MINPYKNCFTLRYQAGCKIIREEREPARDLTTVSLRSNYPTDFAESRTIPLNIFGAGPKGCVLFIHGMGDRNLNHLRWFPENFSRFGFSGALLRLPYHFERTPSGFRSGQMFLETDRDGLRNHFEHSVLDAMTCLDYLASKNYGPLFIMGYSLGGFIATITASLYPEIRRVSLVVSGGNFYHITWKSFATRVLRLRYEEDKTCNAHKCRAYHAGVYREFMESLQGPYIVLNSAPISCLEYDPLTFARFVEQPVLLTGALLDIFVPRKSTLALHQALPDSTLKWLPCGHLTSILFKESILKQTTEFFSRINSPVME
ncbi:MAG: alpha/beta hydrolase family protein [Deltaproteobacteria bacterium]|nr:alpha/beta hydrolase family protein [Deltaproteobacteria bacterium]